MYKPITGAPPPEGVRFTNNILEILPYWPKYDLSTPKNIVLNSNLTYVEDDTFRKEGIDFINSIDRELLA